jgi:hypothetical protein
MSLLSFRALRYVLFGYIQFVLILTVLRLAIPNQSGLVGELTGFVLALTVAMFCVVDARVLRVRLPQSCHQMFFLLWPTALIYLFWSRGYRGLPWALLWLATFVPTLLLAFIFAMMIAVILYRL